MPLDHVSVRHNHLLAGQMLSLSPHVNLGSKNRPCPARATCQGNRQPTAVTRGHSPPTTCTDVNAGHRTSGTTELPSWNCLAHAHGDLSHSSPVGHIGGTLHQDLLESDENHRDLNRWSGPMPDAYAMVRKTDAPEPAYRPTARSMEQASQTPSCSVSVPSDPRRQRKTTMNAHRLVAGQARDHRWKPCLQLATPDNTQIYEGLQVLQATSPGQSQLVARWAG